MLLADRWRRAAALVRTSRDLVEARVPDPAAFGDGAAWLLALDDDALARLESGAAWDGAPAALADLVHEARAVAALPSLAAAGAGRARRHEKARKAAQVDAFAALVQPLAVGAARVVDVGSGHGHLTRELASRIDGVVVGLERDPALVARARALAGGLARFDVHDVMGDGLSLDAGDCAVGLHACGALGDALVLAAAQAGARVALVGCCLQKRAEDARASLAAPEDASVRVAKRALGLSNLTARDVGVEATRAENLAARARRLALARLLEDAGALEREGAELRGLNRRAAHASLDALVARAFALRGLPPPSPAAIGRAGAWAAGEHARARRLALPRQELARALEVFVLVDRARFLEERGWRVTVGEAFPREVSARNLALLAAP